MRSWRENFWLSVLPVAALLGLLILLAFLQYRWLGQISDGERERLQKRLQSDSQRFAEDFNREIGTAYLAFQTEAKIWRENDFAAFNQRFQNWRENVAYPTLIQDIYFVREDKLSRFEPEKKTFTAADWTTDFNNLREKLKSADNTETIDEKSLVLIIPVYESRGGVFLNVTKILPTSEKLRESSLNMPEKFGFLLLKLDENTIKNDIFPALAQKYFSDSEGTNYKLAVVNKADESQVVFASAQSAQLTKNTSDISVPLFESTPGNFSFLMSPELRSKMSESSVKGKAVIFSQKFESKFEQRNVVTESENSNKKTTIQVSVSGNGEKPRIMQTSEFNETGRWLLLVRHAEGSLDQFINNTRRKNLAVSFGILSL